MKIKKKRSTTIPSSYEKGLELEASVEEIYWELGAFMVRSDLRLAGQQLDVYAELPSVDGFTTRVGIDCKNYEDRVGVNEVNKSAQKLALLRQAGEIDLPVLVSANGFTPEGVAAAEALGVKTITLANLNRRIADFNGYLERAIKKYENSRIHSKGLYRNLRCRSEDGEPLGYIDRFTQSWFESGGNFLTILGDYGTGKTTFTERFFWQSAQDYLKDPIKNRIPVFIPLKRYRKEINIRSLITDLLLHEYRVEIRDYGTFNELNRKGRLLIIFDAFDEMATGAEEAEVISNFRELKSLAHESSQIILTCRTHYLKDHDQIHKLHAGTSLYREIDKEGESYKICFLLPYTAKDVKELAYRIDPDNATEYIRVIDKTYNLKDLSRHPILLDMILGTVPDVLAGNRLITPSDLYTTYTGFWLDRDDWRTKMSHSQREFFMKELAFYFQIKGCTEIHFRSLPRYIRQKFPGLKTFKELDYFEADIRTCTFLSRDPLGNYSFIHRSFCEYFAARCAVDFFLEGRWPDHLWKGKSYGPTNWITPETSAFAVDLIEKADAYDEILGNFYKQSLNGALLFCILSVFSFGRSKKYYELFDTAHWLAQDKLLDGVDFRREITSLGQKYHTPNWRRIRKEFKRYAPTGDLGFNMAEAVRKALSEE